MEVGLEPKIPTYSGGLGILAGDTLRAAADLGIPMVAVSLLHRKGYFRQHLDSDGHQTETPADWSPAEYLELQALSVTVIIENRPVRIGAWKYLVHGVTGHVVPVYLLDTAIEPNQDFDRELTDYLYGGDQRYRLCQEVVLGIGGVAILEAMGYADLQVYHMNEGHSALLALALLGKQSTGDATPAALAETCNAVRQQCVFTTHTPVPAGQDQFPTALVSQVLGAERTALLTANCHLNGTLNMTHLALFFSRYVNGVAMHHGALSQTMFPGYPINSITNGVHARTWASVPFQRLFDRHFPEWKFDNLYLRYAVGIPLQEIQQAHVEVKQQLLEMVQNRCKVVLDPTVLTLGFARRATAYKRADLLFSDMDRLRRIARQVGRLQLIFGGKAHPQDEGGKALICSVFKAAANLKDVIHVVYLEDYDMEVAKLICSGVDVWLNTPQRPQEASGTSGMKAALNGVPSLSILDGWWLEGHCEGITGWSIGDDSDLPADPAAEAESLYGKLEQHILPMFYARPLEFAEVMRSAIALNGSFFNAQRMLFQYTRNAYSAPRQRNVAGI